MNKALGVDIGGTNTVFGLVDRNGNCVSANSIPTRSFERPEDLVSAIFKSVQGEMDGNTFAGIGIGAPNGNYFNGTMEHAPNMPWQGTVSFAKLFGDQFSAPAFVTNDANAAAIGEQLFGSAKGKNDVVVVTLGTGVGGGIIIGGKLIYGHDGFAGEIGHAIVEPEGRSCKCGRQGCLETYASVTGIVRTARKRLKEDNSESILHQWKGEELTGKRIAEAAYTGDELTLDIFDFTAQKLGLGLANTAAVTNPQAIVFLGGLAGAGDVLLKPTKRYFESYLLNVLQDKVEFLTTGLKENAAVIGAAALLWQELNN